MNRYSAGHRIVHAGSFVLPMLPVMYVTERYKHGVYDIGAHHVIVLWLIGLLLSYLMVLIHELGHALAGRCVGIQIAEMTIGHWRRLFTVRVGSLPVTFRAAPASGFVRPKPSSHLASRWRMAIFLIGGVAAECLVLILAWHRSDFPAAVNSLGELLGVFCFAMLLWLGVLHLPLNLWPHQGWAAGSRMPNDGAQLLALLRSRDKQKEHVDLTVATTQIEQLVRDGRKAEASALAEELLARHPKNADLVQFTACRCAEAGNTTRAEVLWRSLLRWPLQNEKRAEILDTLACLPLYYGRSDLLPDAAKWTDEALSLVPQAITLKGTRGSVLIELGKLDDGMALLREVIAESECSLDHAISAVYLAKAHYLRGESEQMHPWLAKAKSTSVDHALVKRIVAELESKPGSPAIS